MFSFGFGTKILSTLVTARCVGDYKEESVWVWNSILKHFGKYWYPAP
jgi:hypothetical protein